MERERKADRRERGAEQPQPQQQAPPAYDKEADRLTLVQLFALANDTLRGTDWNMVQAWVTFLAALGFGAYAVYGLDISALAVPGHTTSTSSLLQPQNNLELQTTKLFLILCRVFAMALTLLRSYMTRQGALASRHQRIAPHTDGQYVRALQGSAYIRGFVWLMWLVAVAFTLGGVQLMAFTFYEKVHQHGLSFFMVGACFQLVNAMRNVEDANEFEQRARDLDIGLPNGQAKQHKRQ